MMDEPDPKGFREIREDKDGTEGIIGWIQIDDHDEKEKFEHIILESLNSLNISRFCCKAMERQDELLNEIQKLSARIDGLRDILSILEDRHGIDMSQFDASYASE